jgi:hypothetical protein
MDDAPPAVQFAAQKHLQQQQTQHTPIHQQQSGLGFGISSTSNSISGGAAPFAFAAATSNYAVTADHPLHSLVLELKGEIRELKHRLAVSEENNRVAVSEARMETYLHVCTTLAREGPGGVERLKSVYGGDAAAIQLRQGGASMMLGGGAQRATVHVAAPNVDSDVLTREELHSGLRKALRFL